MLWWLEVYIIACAAITFAALRIDPIEGADRLDTVALNTLVYALSPLLAPLILLVSLLYVGYITAKITYLHWREP